MTLTRAFLAAVLAIAAVLPAAAEGRLWRVDAANSALGFLYTIDGKESEGLFASFSGEARFDPAALEEAELTLLVDPASIDLGEPVGTNFVKSIDWLFVEEHPDSKYVLSSLVALGDDRFQAMGDLTLRGVTKQVGGEITIKLDEDNASAIGEARFDRKEFGIGVGFSALFVEIGPEVAVTFRLVAAPAE